MDDKLFNDIEKEIQEQSNFEKSLEDVDQEKKSTNFLGIAIAVCCAIVLIILLYFSFNSSNKQSNDEIVITQQTSIDSNDSIDSLDDQEGEFTTNENSVYPDPDSSEAVASPENGTDFDQQAEDLLGKKESNAVKTEVKKPVEKKPTTEASTFKPVEKVETKPVVKKEPVKKVVRETNPVIKTNLWSLQLASGQNKVFVEAEWGKLKRLYPSILGSSQHAIMKVDVKGTTYYRLRVVNIDSLKTADDMCGRLKSNNVNCFVTK